MLPISYVDPLFIDWIVDENGEKTSVLVSSETQKVVEGVLVLDYVPDYFYKVTFVGSSVPTIEKEIDKSLTNANEYKVNYRNGFVYVDSSYEGQELEVTYYKRGAIYYPASRIYTDLQNGTIQETLQSFIDDAVEAQQALVDLSEIIAEAELATDNANASATNANQVTSDFEDAEDLRVIAENTRLSNESTRISNESTRQSQESTRQSNETNRISAENARTSAENTRVTSENTRNTNETNRVSAENTRVGAENTRIFNESNRVNAESTRITAENTRNTNESTRQSQESTRQSQESNRQSNESTRQSQEASRSSNELDRENAEDVRENNESTRISAENTRNTNESTRISAENTRISAENTRQSQETTRQSNESTRVTNENTRLANELNREDAENARETNEENRVNDELLRVSAENTRHTNETNRVSAENIRNTNETNRISAENIRNTNESTRQSNESTRQSNESTRQSQESTRVSAENTRVSAETTRQSQESTRQSQEVTRQSNESTRESNEIIRQQKVDNLVHKGEYNSSTTYTIRNIVSFFGSSYMNIQASVGVDPTNTSHWKLVGQKGDAGATLVPRGDYDNFQTYNADDLVLYNGNLYYAIQTTTGNLPTNSTYWGLFLQGSGDMVKAIYDTNNNGIVDNAERLGNQLPSYYETVNNKGVVNGYASLDSTGKLVQFVDATKITGVLALSNIPKSAQERIVVVSNESARYSLTINDVQNGDVVKQNDTEIMYFVVDDTNLNNTNGYEIFHSGIASSVPFSGITDLPTTLSGYGITDATPISHIGSGGSSHAIVTTTVNGFMSSTDKVKLNSIQSGAEVNVNANWDATSGDAQILNKPDDTSSDVANTLVLRSNEKTFGITGIDFTDQGASPTLEPIVGRLLWNSDYKTLDLGTSADTTLQIGQETVYHALNQSGQLIEDGTLVMATGTTGNSGKITIAHSVADGTYPSEVIMGIATQRILNGEEGFVTHFGKVNAIDTTGDSVNEVWQDGDILYAHPSIAGRLTKVRPSAPNLKVIVAIVIHAHSNGALFVRPSHSHTLNENTSDIEITNPANNDFLVYNQASGYWENKSQSTLSIGNADKLDGLYSSQFLRSDINDTMNGNLTITGNLQANGIIALALGEGLQFRDSNDYFGTNLDARIMRMVDGNGTNGNVDGGLVIEAYTSTDGVSVELLRVRNGEFKYKGSTIWHSGNDGSGSGLDSDLLDGQNASYYLDWTNVTNKPDPTITLSGDATGSVTLTDLGNGTLSVSIVDDSHNHIISNIDGLQTALDSKLNSSIYTASDILTKLKTVDGSGSGLDADLLDGLSSGSFIRSDTSDSITGLLTINRVGEMLRLGGTTALDADDAYIYIGNPTYAWNLKYVGNGTGEDGNEFRIESTNTGKYIQLDHSGNFEYYDGTSVHKIWNGANDGSGSGLDADKLDNLESTQFLRSDADDALNGSLIINKNTAFPLTLQSDGAEIAIGIEFKGHSTQHGYIQADHLNTTSMGANYSFHIGSNQATTNLIIDDGLDIYVGTNKVYHQGNDGSGSGLDSDLLDGVQGSNYARTDIEETFTNDVVIQGSGTTIGGSNIDNAILKIGDSLGLDNNEIYFKDIDSYIGVIGAYDLDISVNGNTTAFKANGDVGIGTTAPSEKLHVVGKTQSDNGFKTGDFEMVFDSSTNSLNFNYVA